MGTVCETDGGLFVGYFCLLIVFFCAVGVVADIFMGSIENITAKEKTVGVALIPVLSPALSSLHPQLQILSPTPLPP